MTAMVSIEKSTFLKALKTVGPAVAPKSTLPVLQFVLVEVQTNQVQISGTNLELGIQTRFPAMPVDTGAICLPYKNLVDLVTAMKDQASMEINLNCSVTFRAGRSQSTIKGMDPLEFPPFPEFIEPGSAGPNFAAIAERVAFSVSKDESRPVLQGVLLKQEAGKLVASATDGFRITILETEQAFEGSMIIPTRAVLEMAKLETPKICIDPGRQLMAADDTTTIASSLISGSFPNVNDILPKHCATEITVNSNELLQALRQAMAIAKESIYLVAIESKPEGEQQGISISSVVDSLGECDAWVPVKQVGVNIKPTGFNVHFLLEAIKGAGGEEVTLGCSQPNTPVVLKGRDPNWKHVIMPMYVNR